MKFRGRFKFWVNSIRTRIVLVFFLLLISGGLATSSIGSWIVSSTILDTARKKVAHDIRTAWMIYNTRLNMLKIGILMTSERIEMDNCDQHEISHKTRQTLKIIKKRFRMDFISIANCKGDVVLRASDDGGDGNISDQNFFKLSMKGQTIASTEVFSIEQVRLESQRLAEEVVVRVDDKKGESRIDSAMVLLASAPVYNSRGKVSGCLYGGVLLNNNNEIVDSVKEIVYKKEKFYGKETGISTIFFKDIRIATNVITQSDKRAIGTRLSQEVASRVLTDGKTWRGEARVGDDVYISAYDPIRDLSGEIIGILNVGILREPFVSVRNQVIVAFFAIASLCLILIIIGTHFLTRSIIGPLEKMVVATEEITKGNLNVEVHCTSEDEIAQLARHFNMMSKSLKTMQKRWEERMQDQLVQSEKLASLGKMAAGVAHEMNSPLTGIMTFSHLLARKYKKATEEYEWLEIIIGETERCARIVRQLLDFARETQPDMKPSNVNEIIAQTLELVTHQAIFHDINVKLKFDEKINSTLLDPNQIKQALLNIILNAVDAMEGKGALTIETKFDADGKKDNREFIRIIITDTGCGIPQNIIDKIFDPFFTTKEVGKGTGLGLAVTYGIVKRHGGEINVRSEVGRGTTFTIELPVMRFQEMENGVA